MSNGWSVAILENVQAVYAFIAAAYFLVANSNYVGVKMKQLDVKSVGIKKEKKEEESFNTIEDKKGGLD